MVVDVRTAEERNARARAVGRFCGWFVVTGDQADEVGTEMVRKAWWLAHQDVGLTIPKSERRNGVETLVAMGATKGRGVLRGVAEADAMLEEAEAIVADVLGGGSDG